MCESILSERTDELSSTCLPVNTISVESAVGLFNPKCCLFALATCLNDEFHFRPLQHACLSLQGWRLAGLGCASTLSLKSRQISARFVLRLFQNATISSFCAVTRWTSCPSSMEVTSQSSDSERLVSMRVSRLFLCVPDSMLVILVGLCVTLMSFVWLCGPLWLRSPIRVVLFLETKRS